MNMNGDELRIFSSERGAVVIKSSAKNRIIELLRGGEKTSREIREEIGKAKSTTSVHLSDLKELGIIEEKVHPEDERVKIFYLKSKFLGKSGTPFSKHYEEILGNLRDAAGEEYAFLKSLFHLIRFGLISFGLDVHPALKEIGRDAGKSLAENFSEDTIEDLIEEIDEFWQENGLGTVDFIDDHLLIKDCFDCEDMPNVGHTLCSLDEGLIEGIMEERLGRKVTLSEIECHGTGADHCKFRMEM